MKEVIDQVVLPCDLLKTDLEAVSCKIEFHKFKNKSKSFNDSKERFQLGWFQFGCRFLKKNRCKTSLSSFSNYEIFTNRRLKFMRDKGRAFMFVEQKKECLVDTTHLYKHLKMYGIYLIRLISYLTKDLAINYYLEFKKSSKYLNSIVFHSPFSF